MTEYAASGQSVSGSAAVHHTLQRHRDILQDYRQEYSKTRANIQAVIEREDLLSSVHRDIDDYRSVATFEEEERVTSSFLGQILYILSSAILRYESFSRIIR